MSDFYQSHLDEFADDAAARLLFGEYLAERGDSDAAGYLWMAKRAKRPLYNMWFFDDDSIPSAVGLSMRDAFDGQSEAMYPTCRAAELALCRAVSGTQE